MVGKTETATLKNLKVGKNNSLNIMRKILRLFIVFTTLMSVFSSCSSDDSGDNSNSKIVGTWGTKWDNGKGIAIQPEFSFLGNGKVKYYIYPNAIGIGPELAEIGTWSMSEEILTMEFPETVLIKFKNKVIFTSDTQI